MNDTIENIEVNNETEDIVDTLLEKYIDLTKKGSA